MNNEYSVLSTVDELILTLAHIVVQLIEVGTPYREVDCLFQAIDGLTRYASYKKNEVEE